MAPCPICGSRLRRTQTGWHHPTVKEGSPVCPLTGHHFGDAYMDIVGWPKPLTYSVVNGGPVIGHNSTDPVATAEFLNECFNYLANNGGRNGTSN